MPSPGPRIPGPLPRPSEGYASFEAEYAARFEGRFVMATDTAAYRELLEALREFFDRVLRNAHPDLLAAIRAQKVPGSDVEDVRHGVYVAFLRRFLDEPGCSLGPRPHFLGYLMVCARRAGWKATRTATRPGSWEDDGRDIPDTVLVGGPTPPPRDPATLAQKQEVLAALAACRDEVLDQRERDALDGLYGQGLARKAVAKRIGVQDSNAGFILNRARRKLHQCLQGKGHDSR